MLIGRPIAIPYFPARKTTAGYAGVRKSSYPFIPHPRPSAHFAVNFPMWIGFFVPDTAVQI